MSTHSKAGIMKNLFQAVLLAASLLVAAAFPVKADGIFNPGSSGGGGGALGFTPQQVFNVTDQVIVGGVPQPGAACDGSASDDAAINRTLTAAFNSPAYQNNNGIKIVFPRSGSQQGCQWNSLNWTQFSKYSGANTRPIVVVDGLNGLCSGAGNVCNDLSGATDIIFINSTIRGDPASPPRICVQAAAISDSNSAAWHHFTDIKCNGNFTFTPYYNGNSEANVLDADVFENSQSAVAPIAIQGGLGSITGGSLYTNGTYTNVDLTGGCTGADPLATVIVSGAIVTAVQITFPGFECTPGNTLTTANSNIGGTGSGFSVPIAAVKAYTTVIDGQDYWRSRSAFVSITRTPNTWGSATLITFKGGSSRQASTGGAIWMSWGGAIHFSDYYVLNSSGTTCVDLFDSGVTKSGIPGPNWGMSFDKVNCEGSSLSSAFNLIGANATPTLYDFRYQGYHQAQAMFGTDTNITSASIQNADISLEFANGTGTAVPMFASAKLWTVSSKWIWAPSTLNWNAPATFKGNISLAGSVGPFGPVDIMGSAAVAISCARLLNQAYIGPLCNFQRASDSGTLDIYPNAAGNLDPNTFTTFCNATTCKLRIAYDQSGNGNNCSQTTAANQPTFSLQLATLGSRPAFTFGDAGALALSCPAAATINNLWNTGGGYAVAVVNQPSNATATDRIVEKTSWQWVINNGSSGNRLLDVFSTSGGDWTASTALLGSKIIDVLYTSNTVAAPQFSINGTNVANTSTTQPVGTYSDDSGSALIIGNTAVTGGVTGYAGSIAEMVAWKVTPTAGQLESLRRNQAAYYGLGATVN